MHLKNLILLKCFVLAFILLIINPGFSQVKHKETVSVSGYIERINEDLDVIHVKGMRIMIPPKTKRVDQNGNTFKQSLNRNFYVEIEAIQNRDVLLAKKIIVKSQRRGSK
jgi:hypothetical protein